MPEHPIVHLLPPAPDGPNGHADASCAGAPNEAGSSASGQPWNEDDFSPFYEPEPGDYVADGCETFRTTPAGRRVRICGFVPELQAQRSTIHNLDAPDADTTRIVTVRITTPAGDDVLVDVPVEKGRSLSAAIVDAVPSGLARLSVASSNEVGRAAAAFTSPTFETTTTFGQTGWLPNGGFAFPGGGDVSLERLGTSPGVALLDLPREPSIGFLGRAAEVLLRVYCAAPAALAGGVLGTIAASPMFRSRQHLGARGWTTLVAGPTGVGKTLFVSRMYSLLGDFSRQPGCIATFRTTLPTLESFLHTLRDMPVYVDNFRLADPGAREKFRALVISVGDGTAKGRSLWGPNGLRVLGAPGTNSLLLATGEDSFTDDAAVSARLLEFHADEIDRATLIGVTPEDLACLPHLYAGFVHFLRHQSEAWWSDRRASLAKLTEGLLAQTATRTSEHLATLTTALVTFCEYICVVAPATAPAWREVALSFVAAGSAIADVQATRVREERVDQIVLREIARALRERTVALQPGSGATPTGGTVLGAFDADFVYLIPDVTTRWAASAVRSRARGADLIGRKGLLWALQARGKENGTLVFRTIEGKRTRTWRVRRDGLGDNWAGLLAAVAARQGAPPQPQAAEGGDGDA